MNAHVHVSVHIVDRARDLRKRLSHERVRAVDLALRDDRVRLKVRDGEARATVDGAVVSSACPRRLLSKTGKDRETHRPWQSSVLFPHVECSNSHSWPSHGSPGPSQYAPRPSRGQYDAHRAKYEGVSHVLGLANVRLCKASDGRVVPEHRVRPDHRCAHSQRHTTSRRYRAA